MLNLAQERTQPGLVPAARSRAVGGPSPSGRAGMLAVPPAGQVCGGTPKLRIGGVPVDVASLDGLAERMVADVMARRHTLVAPALPELVFSANGQALSMYGRDPGFRALLDQANVIHADGMSLVFAASWLTREGLPGRVATTDFFDHAARAAVAAGISFYFLGGPERPLRAAESRVRARYPQLDLRGCHHGYFAEEETDQVLESIRAARPDVLWVGLGRPKQEAFCVKYRAALAGVTWLKTCGGLFAFLSGDAPRAPQWMRRASLEWAYRTAHEPRRLFWRYLVTNIDSIILMARSTREIEA